MVAKKAVEFPDDSVRFANDRFFSLSQIPKVLGHSLIDFR